MDWNSVALLASYIIGLVILLGVGVYAFRHREVNGALQFSWYVFARSLWTLGLILEFLSPALNGKIFWSNVEVAGAAITTILFPVFVTTYVELKLKRPALTWSLLGFTPAVLLLLSMTNNFHEFLVRNPQFEEGNPFSLLRYEITPAFWGYAIYGLALTQILLGILVGKFIHAQPLERSKAFIIAFGVFLDTIGVGLALALRQRQLILVASAVSGSIVAWGLFRYRLFNLKPIAREILFEKMTDLVVVLDAQDRIADINPSALKQFNMTASRVIGKPVASVFFSEWEEFREPVDGSKEFFIKRNGKYYHFDVHATILRGSSGEYQGRIFVARDITNYASLQWQLKELNEQLRALNADLEGRVRTRTEELAEAYDTTLQGWARALELRDKETEGHSRRVTDLTLKLARALDVAEAELDDIRRGALLHDIGKMAIPDEILRKTDALTGEERGIVAEHPVIAYRLLSPIKFLEKALEIPYCHHEKWDGTGYPRGLKGEQIPLSARIFSVVDVWDAVRSDRPYRRAWSRSKACAYIREQARSYFDPHVVNVFLNLIQNNMI